ncbi:hypothetical protein FZEAL_2667 [Fusarium zealandicum]|uniref:C2H2-type domain-containing protein n=1 Tax=Fusarium zealandicum TaxID=1053134 RepID=A0A8H4XMJ2_9HYPO|nr:hypothetical protein FZEAL_2667 [Fusarium zealandicum]
MTTILFNPFDALGIDAKPASRSDIIRAWTGAMKARHPDHSTHGSVASFPTLEQVQEARTFLLAALGHKTLDEEVREFQHWPRIFYPDTATHDKSPFRDHGPHSDYLQCPECRGVWPRDRLSAHIKTHRKLGCGYCDYQAVFHSKQDMESHREVCRGATHKAQSCLYCGRLVDFKKLLQHMGTHHASFPRDCDQCLRCDEGRRYFELVDHIKLDHELIQCPFCDDRHHKHQLHHHLDSQHALEGCASCPEQICSAADVVHHAREFHHALACPACKMGVFDQDLFTHLRGSHYFTECLDCPFVDWTVNGSDLSHFKSHQWTLCRVQDCIETVEQGALHLHLARCHDLLTCPHCVECFDTSAALEEHASNRHPRVECVDCTPAREMLESEYHEHQRQVHGKQDCPFCPVRSEEQESLQRHIYDYHAPTKSCPVCSFKLTASQRDDHLRQQHGYRDCDFCGLMTSPLDMPDHLVDHGDLDSCVRCDKRMLRTEMSHHLVLEHGYTMRSPERSTASDGQHRTRKSLKRPHPQDSDDGDSSFDGEQWNGQDSTTESSREDSAPPRRPPAATEAASASRRRADLTGTPYGSSGDCPYGCKNANVKGGQYLNLDQHMRRRHNEKRRDTKRRKEETVQCVDGKGTHSKSNVSRCALCKAAKDAARAREAADGQTEEDEQDEA